MSHFTLNIFTPHGILVRGLKVDSILVPTQRGELDILPKHTHIISSLETGILTARTDAGPKRFSITSGLLKVLGEKITVLSTTSEMESAIDLDRAKTAKAKAESRLSSSNSILTDVERIKFERKLERAKTRIRLANLK